MTLVNAETGELLAEMTPDEARQVTDRIRTALGVAWELVADAYKRRAWAAMGYSTWDDYTSAEFGAARLRLPREERQEVVASLRDAGLSIRAIAAATGVHTDTVQSDLRSGVRIPHTSTPPEVEPQSAAAVPSGETGEAPPPRSDLDNTETDVDVMERLRAAADAEKKITGTDGKSYPDKSRAAVAQRVGKAKAMAKEGYSSRQIAEALGIDDFPAFKARHGVVVPADASVGRTRHLDSDRIVNETVSTLEGLVMGLNLVQMDGLDPDQIDHWATSLNDSLRLLGRFQKQLKEMTQ